MTKPIQRIIFGSPGTGKSHLITDKIIPSLIKDENKRKSNVIYSVFHPEYTYGDFMGKLLPMTTKSSGGVEYSFYEGHFLKAIAEAYRNYFKAHNKDGELVAEVDNVILVIDEINRGNSSAIFGSVFQLLDRDNEGWSSYSITLNGITFMKFLDLIKAKFPDDTLKPNPTHLGVQPFTTDKKTMDIEDLNKKTCLLNLDLVNKTIKIPPNLHIVATMNTSDSSIYHMDTAFKRRWEWQFIDVDEEHSKKIEDAGQGIAFYSEQDWTKFIAKLNEFIKSNHSYIRGIEDKQIGRYFIRLPAKPILC